MAKAILYRVYLPIVSSGCSQDGMHQLAYQIVWCQSNYMYNKCMESIYGKVNILATYFGINIWIPECTITDLVNPRHIHYINTVLLLKWKSDVANYSTTNSALV